MRRKSVEIEDSPENLKASLLENKSYLINNSTRGSKFSVRKMSSISAEDEEPLETEPIVYNKYTGAKENKKNPIDLINMQEIAIERKIQFERLAYLNIASYMVEVIILSIIIWLKSEGNIFHLEKFDSPLALNNNLKNAAWTTVFILKAVFAWMPLLIDHDDFEDILIDKIKYSFSLL
mmetsp:Transcript_28968/g.33068  ORF Transcript_28968/g.33068 Transcript_28968/m.33068 type:complete len:178 (+) Transcript_28968:18-551(+)